MVDPKKEGIAHFLTPEEMNKLSRLTLLSRYVVEGNLAGAHRSPNKGASSEFADHKQYMIGDDPKHIDWKVFGRTDRYYIKRYEDETNLRVYFIVDSSASMAYSADDRPSKFEYACQLTAAMGYVIVKVRDSAGVFLSSDKIEFKMNAMNSILHLNNMCKNLQYHKPRGTTELATNLHQIAEAIGKRALIILVSDLMADPEQITLALAHFRKQNHDVIVFHTLDPSELNLSFKRGCVMEDMETHDTVMINPRSMAKAYQEEFEKFLTSYREACSAMNVDYRVIQTDEPVATFARAYLEERRRLSK